ncbi:MAG: NADH-quinone oxidoreductase subunit L [Acidimicrobiia bacterium]
MLENAWVIPVIPVVSFWLILLFGKRFPGRGAGIGVVAIGVTFVLSLVVAGQWIARDPTVEVHHAATTAGGPVGHGEQPAADHALGAERKAELKRAPVLKEWTWFENQGVAIRIGTLVDGLAVALLLVVGTVSFAVHVFSTAYMRDDRRKTHYFAALSLFTSGMYILVTSSNTLQMILGWEIMGLCSFMLIGHWWEEYPNARAALKAFFTTRTGDTGLLIGVSMLYFLAKGSFEIERINRLSLAGAMDRGLLTVAAAALLVAVIGKSAQFPLHTWLPDAMAGPTPVSALIHAATMVVAGVFLIARLYGVFWKGFDIGAGDGYTPVAMVGGITILIAAALAFVQSDIKKVLAYSTVSQLGYMVMALGVGAWTAGVFHLFTHAFFKACLFLGAGSVSHSGSHHSFDMKADMGGLRKHMPVTHATFVIASLALAGLPPLAGFWSKDEILLGAGEGGYRAFMVVGLVGAAMTAAYMTRCVYLTFYGEPRGAAAHHHPHESPPAITVPLVVLAALAVGAGFLNAPGVERFTEWFEPAFVAGVVTHHEFSVSTAVVGTLVGLAGIAVAGAYWFAGVGQGWFVEHFAPARAGYRLLENRYYLDHLYEKVIVAGISGPVARAVYWFDQRVIDAIVNAVGLGARRTAGVVYDVIDQAVVDGVVNGVGTVSSETGGILRLVQTGRVQLYAAVFFLGVAAFAAALWLAT